MCDKLATDNKELLSLFGTTFRREGGRWIRIRDGREEVFLPSTSASDCVLDCVSSHNQDYYKLINGSKTRVVVKGKMSIGPDIAAGLFFEGWITKDDLMEAKNGDEAVLYIPKVSVTNVVVDILVDPNLKNAILHDGS